MTRMNYGTELAHKILCKKHEQFHPANENCPWCPEKEHGKLDPDGGVVTWQALLTREVLQKQNKVS